MSAPFDNFDNRPAAVPPNAQPNGAPAEPADSRPAAVPPSAEPGEAAEPVDNRPAAVFPSAEPGVAAAESVAKPGAEPADTSSSTDSAGAAVATAPAEEAHSTKPRKGLARALEVCALLVLPVSMTSSVFAGYDLGGSVGMVAAVISIGLFFLSYEYRFPSLHETMPVVVLAALAAAGRIIFAFIPSVQPMTAIIIIGGCIFGRKSGFMIGALSGLVSAFFVGMGAWVPWQMYTWALIGWTAGILGKTSLFKAKWPIYVFGFASGLLYGLILNLWSIIGFYHPETLAQLLLLWGAAIPFDIIHSVSTVVFLGLLWAPWHRKLARLKTLYALGDAS